MSPYRIELEDEKGSVVAVRHGSFAHDDAEGVAGRASGRGLPAGLAARLTPLSSGRPPRPNLELYCHRLAVCRRSQCNGRADGEGPPKLGREATRLENVAEPTVGSVLRYRRRGPCGRLYLRVSGSRPENAPDLRGRHPPGRSCSRWSAFSPSLRAPTWSSAAGVSYGRGRSLRPRERARRGCYSVNCARAPRRFSSMSRRPRRRMKPSSRRCVSVRDTVSMVRPR